MLAILTTHMETRPNARFLDTNMQSDKPTFSHDDILSSISATL